jgi:hypothetical protein
MLDLETAGCSVLSIASDSLRAVHPVSGSHLKEHLTFPNYVAHREWMHLVNGSHLKQQLTFPNYVAHRDWNFYVNIVLYSKSTISIPLRSSLTFRNNRMDLECRKLIQPCSFIIQVNIW